MLIAKLFYTCITVLCIANVKCLPYIDCMARARRLRLKRLKWKDSNQRPFILKEVAEEQAL